MDNFNYQLLDNIKIVTSNYLNNLNHAFTSFTLPACS
jgi:hypothetical protein